MRLSRYIVGISVFCATAAYAIMPACEEVLDVCAPCGSLAEGSISELGDPRIDGTLYALGLIQQRIYTVSRAHDAALHELAASFDTSIDETIDQPRLVQQLELFLQSEAIASYIADWQSPQCYVDWDRAIRFQQKCEKSLCNLTQDNESALCNGHFEGVCPGGSNGQCFTESKGACNGMCIGVCSDAEHDPCPGLCMGTCDGDCSAYDAAGNCAGRCTGICNGSCESNAPFHCNGHCFGKCGTSAADAGCSEESTYWGDCPESVHSGHCRGHLYPAGCDNRCPNCDENKIVHDCRETAKLLAWAGTTCTPADLHLTINFGDPNSDNAELIYKKQLLTRILRQMATDRAWLSLLLDGTDPANQLMADYLKLNRDTSRLDNATDQYIAYYESPEGQDNADAFEVDWTRVHLPLENLKIRISWLSLIAIDSEKGYRISAGAFPCLEPSLSEALDILSSMIPVKPGSPSDSTPYTSDRTCSSSTPDDPAPCLYRILDSQNHILEPFDR